MDKKLRELVKQWIMKADHDLMAIENELNSENPVTDIICFHAQQASEKYLKAFLIFHQINFPYTHDIGKLINICKEKHEDFLSLKPAIKLTDYAVELRYPDDFYIPTLEEAKYAYSLATKTKKYVIEKLKRKK